MEYTKPAHGEVFDATIESRYDRDAGKTTRHTSATTVKRDNAGLGWTRITTENGTPPNLLDPSEVTPESRRANALPQSPIIVSRATERRSLWLKTTASSAIPIPYRVIFAEAAASNFLRCNRYVIWRRHADS